MTPEVLAALKAIVDAIDRVADRVDTYAAQDAQAHADFQVSIDELRKLVAERP